MRSRLSISSAWTRAIVPALALLAPLLAASNAFAASNALSNCLRDDAEVKGQLRRIETRHPTGARLVSYHLHLWKPICARAEKIAGGKGALKGIRSVQLSLADSEALGRFDALLGATVTASGHFMAPHTVYHTADVVLMSARIIRVTDRPGSAGARESSAARESAPPESSKPPENSKPPESSKPEFVASEPEDIKTRFARFIREFYLAGFDLSAEEIRAIYAPRLFYSGKSRVSVSRVIEDKLRYYKRWPERRYVLLDDTLKIRRARQNRGAWDLVFQYTFDVSASGRSRRGRGIAYLTVDLTGSKVHILREHSKVLKRF